jgi:flagellar motor protein MotB
MVNLTSSIKFSLQLSLFNTGSDALSKEFRDMLTRHSKVIPAVGILEMIEEGNTLNSFRRFEVCFEQKNLSIYAYS